MPMPVSIEGTIGDSLKEWDKIENVRDITARPGHYLAYKLKWVINNLDIVENFSDAQNQYMPVIISDTVGMFQFYGFVQDFTFKTLYDTPPLYEISLVIESDVMEQE